MTLHDEPLRRFPIIHTHVPDEMRRVLVTTYGARGFEVLDPEGFQGRANFLQLEDMGLGYITFGSRSIVDFPEADFARILIGLRGAGETIAGGKSGITTDSQSAVVSPGDAATMHHGTGYAPLVLRINRTALERMLALILGARPGGALHFDAAVSLDRPAAATLRRQIEFMAQQLDADAAPLPAALLRQMQQTITVAFLYGTQHSFSGLLEQETRGAAPVHVLRAENYIEANWQREVSIEALCEVTGHSARSLFRAFQQTRGYSPMAFAKRVRLDRAKAMLSKPDEMTSVTGVAFVCGFANLGHFAREYRVAFNELPSDTLRRAR